MTKSIEKMWADGFINEEQLMAPKINDLYNRKSQNVIDKLRNMFALNIYAIIIGSLIMLVAMTFIGIPFLGIYICCLLIPLIIIAKKELNKSVNLSKGQSSYDYLMSFDDWLKSSIETYSRYYKFAYPLLFLGMAAQGILSETGGMLIGQLIEVLPTSLMLLGLPYYLILTLTAGTWVISKLADPLYRLDLNIVYGRQFKKLEELITDMKELRSEV